MPIVGFTETGIYWGAINTTTTHSVQHNFAPATVWSRPYLQTLSLGDDSTVTANVSQFTDNAGSHSGDFHPGIFQNKCTQVTFSTFFEDCVAHVIFTSEIFG
jgi:hypothetical protein